MQGMMTGNLIIKPLKGELTHDTEFLGKMDPYIKFRLGGQEFKTKVHSDGGKMPVWSDVFNVRRQAETTLQFWVYDQDVVSDDFVGEAIFDLGQVCFPGGHFSNFVPIYFKGKSAGKIYLEIQFIPDQMGMGMGMNQPFPPYPNMPMPMAPGFVMPPGHHDHDHKHHKHDKH